MAALALKRPLLPYKLYKAFEDAAEERHIFWGGEIYAMSGASDDHSTMTTRDFDRGDNFAYYRSFPSVMEVVFVEQDRIGAERCTRAPDGSWNHRELGPGEDLVLSSVDVRVPLDDLYEGTARRPAV